MRKSKRGFTRPKFFSKISGGFTLIELLVVIAIIGVLASVVLASLNTARKKARDARRVADIKQIQLALELYFDSQGNTYPATVAALVTNNYLPTEPKDPLTAAIYPYAFCSATSYHLGATMEQTGGSALASDIDKENAVLCAGDAVDGLSTLAACAAQAGITAANDLCYDVVP